MKLSLRDIRLELFMRFTQILKKEFLFKIMGEELETVLFPYQLHNQLLIENFLT